MTLPNIPGYDAWKTRSPDDDRDMRHPDDDAYCDADELHDLHQERIRMEEQEDAEKDERKED